MRPRFSIVIPFYDGFPFIEECVNSVLQQRFSSMEVLIVDDRDSAHTGDCLDALYGGEPRVKVIHREANGGTLCARRDGVLASSGEYVMLMDQDDILAAGALPALDEDLSAAPVDILHFGVKVVAESTAAEDASSGMSEFLKAPVRELFGNDILRYQFAQESGFDWQVHHKVYAADVAKKAWGLATAEHLSYADDLYASFILCLVANSYRAIKGVWYEYHLGRGETLGNDYSLDNFKRWCSADAQAFCSTKAFVEDHRGEFERSDYEERLSDVRDLLVAHSMNEIFDNLPLEDRQAAIDYALGLWPADAVAGELWRLVRDRAYSLYDSGELVGASDILFRLKADAESVSAKVNGPASKRFYAMREAAANHINELERRARFAPGGEPTLGLRPLYEAQPIRIFVTTHKDVETYHSNVLQPVQVGPVQNRKRLSWAYQDDSGENIASQNPMYCELTTQYWAWKNVDAEYYGFCHYRRYFDFSEEEHQENPWGEVIDNTIDWGTQERYCLDDASIASAVEGYDIVTTGIKDLAAFPEAFTSTRDHYARAPYLKIKHLDRIIQILKETHPDYAEDADAFLAGSETCFCNMYTMRKDLFFRYCEWMFPMLERFVAEWDTTLLSREALRTPGHLSERLFNIWLNHEKRVNPELKHKQVQCVHFECPEHVVPPELGAADGAGKQVVPVVFAADNNYVPMVTTTAYSMLVNASKDCFYDIVILEKDFTDENKQLMREFFAQFENASIRFANVAGMVSRYNLQTSNEHISVETYYRFLIQKVLPGYDKVLYLDSDLLVLGDVSQLFATKLGGNLLAAAHDIDYLGNLNMNDGERLAYTKEVLQMEDPYSYFQAGVLVLNLAEMRKLYPFEKWLEIASEPKYIYDDQDILNAHCEGRVVYLDNEWNVMNDCCGRIQNFFSFAPADIYDKFLAAYANPKIIHYAGGEKPWKPGPCDLQMRYWQYARKTPFYEAMLSASIEMPVVVEPFRHEPAISEDSPLRTVFDGVLPMGSRRREAAKAAVRFARGRK